MKIIRAALSSFLIASLTFFPMSLTPADALLSATTGNFGTPLSTGTASFVLFATNSSGGANPNGVALTLSNSTSAQYFYVRNTGSVAISAFSLSVTYTSTPSRTDFYRCEAEVVFSARNTCASGIRTTVTTSSGVAVVSMSLLPNSWVAFEIDPKKLTTPTIGASVSSSQIRPGLIINS